MPTPRLSFALEAVDADLEAWLRSHANMSAVIRASLVEFRERPGQLARIEEKLDLLLSRTAPRIDISVDGLTDEERALVAEMLRRQGGEP